MLGQGLDEFGRTLPQHLDLRVELGLLQEIRRAQLLRLARQPFLPPLQPRRVGEHRVTCVGQIIQVAHRPQRPAVVAARAERADAGHGGILVNDLDEIGQGFA